MLLGFKFGDDCLRPPLVIDIISEGNCLNVGRNDGATGDVIVVEKLHGDDVSETRVIMSRCQSSLHPLKQQCFAFQPLRHRLDASKEIGVVADHMHRGATEADRDLNGPDELASNGLVAVCVLVALEDHNALFVDNVPEEVGAVAAALHMVCIRVLSIPRSVRCYQLTIRPFFELPSDPDLADVRVGTGRGTACMAHGSGGLRDRATVAVGAYVGSIAWFAIYFLDPMDAKTAPVT
jgi:hypothetical protein